jgi:hypothetical protein
LRISTALPRSGFLLVICSFGCAALIAHSAWDKRDLHMRVAGQEAVSIFAKVPKVAAVTTDRKGYVYVLSRADNTITKISPAGSIEKVIGPSLEHGYQIQVPSAALQPLHVDDEGRIYIFSAGMLFIINEDGKVLNADAQGTMPPGFRVGFVTWIGTRIDGGIYVFPSLEGKRSLVSVIGLDGAQKGSFGDRLFSQKSGSGVFRLAVDRRNNLYAFPTDFAAMVKYGPSGEFAGYHGLRLSPALEQIVASQNLSLDAALRLDEQGRQDISLGGFVVFLDVKILSNDSILCLTGDNSLVWYDQAGNKLRELNLAAYMFHHRSASVPPGFIQRFALSPDDGISLASMETPAISTESTLCNEAQQCAREPVTVFPALPIVFNQHDVGVARVNLSIEEPTPVR